MVAGGRATAVRVAARAGTAGVVSAVARARARDVPEPGRVPGVARDRVAVAVTVAAGAVAVVDRVPVGAVGHHRDGHRNGHPDRDATAVTAVVVAGLGRARDEERENAETDDEQGLHDDHLLVEVWPVYTTDSSFCPGLPGLFGDVKAEVFAQHKARLRIDGWKRAEQNKGYWQ